MEITAKRTIIVRKHEFWNSKNAKRILVYWRDKFRCVYCGVVLNGEGCVDHVLPTCDLGGDTYDNLVACCKACNQQKGTRRLDRASMQKIVELTAKNSAELKDILGIVIPSIVEKKSLHERVGPQRPPNCPECGACMVLKFHSGFGKFFWGCPNFPECKGRRSIPYKVRKYIWSVLKNDN